MKKRLTEQSILFISVLKWFILATIIGAVVGFSTMIFLKLLNKSIAFTGKSPYSFLLLPLAFFLSALLVKYLAPNAEGHGTEKVIEAVHKHSGKIKAAVVPVKLVATIITLALGGSAGKEGPCAQIGAGLSSLYADLFKFDDHDRRKLVICGISAGFAAVFGTPIAGALFGVEVLFIGSILYDVLLPSFIAGVTSYHVMSAFGVTYFNHPIHVTAQFNEFFFIEVCVAGIFFGVCSLFLVEILKLGKMLSEKLNLWKPFKGIIGGAILVGLAFIFSKQYLGLGLETIENCLAGQKIPSAAFLLKMIFTSLTLNFGGSGGIVTPIFFVGATAGSFFASITGSDQATFAAIGLVSLLAGSANTPIAASVMAIEIFGPDIAAYAAVSCIISFLISGHRSVYHSQILSMNKSSSLSVETGKEIADAKVILNLRKKSVSKNLTNVYSYLRGIFLKK